MMLNKLVNQWKQHVAVRWLPGDKYYPGISFWKGAAHKNENFPNIKPPIAGLKVALNNWVVGNDKKVSRAKTHGYWFWDNEKDQCVVLSE